MTSGDVVRKLLGQEIRNVLKFYALARRNDAEGVHQLRVSVRRIRSDLLVVRPVLKKKFTDAMDHELRWTSALLGRQRDLDVFTALMSSLGYPLDDGALFQTWQRREKNARHDVRKFLNSGRYRRLLLLWTNATLSPPFTSRENGDAREELWPQIHSTWTTLMNYVDDLGSAPNNADLHRLRILVKKSRYGAEIATCFDDGAVADISSALGEAQRTLGHYHDGVMALSQLDHLHAAIAANGCSIVRSEQSKLMARDLMLHLDEHRQQWRVPVQRARSLIEASA